MANIIFEPIEDTDFGTDNVYTDLNFTISASIETLPEETDPETITSMSISADYSDANAILTNGISNCSISGHYTLDLFNNQDIKYVDKSPIINIDSPKTDVQTITSTNNSSSVPDEKDVFQYFSDSRHEILITYTVTVTTSTGAQYNANYTYTVRQTYDNVKNWVNDYYNNRYNKD